jgi:transposase-like protein
MAKITRKRYSQEFKFKVVLEVLKGKRKAAEIAKVFKVHPITLHQWKREFLENGPEVFHGGSKSKSYENRIKELERLLGQKEVEIALIKNFLREN